MDDRPLHRFMRYSHRCLPKIADIPASTWDALGEPNNPFTRHSYLKALEDAGCVGLPGSGWQPSHLVIEADGQTVCAVPLYEKTDSYGEYIFDWAWAQGSLDAGLAYYPKLVGAVPYTPASGRRILRADGVSLTDIAPVVVAAIKKILADKKASGAHLLFCDEDEAQALAQAGFIPRKSFQFHWQREKEWQSFDDFLQALRAPNRKQVKKERARAQSHGLTFSMRDGATCSTADWQAMYGFYRATVWEKGANAYLTERFFARLHAQPQGSVWVAMAHRGDVAVAGALYFRAGTSLFGRYWGASETLDCLHFELCYYLPIAWGLAHGIERFEAGAQGIHKLKRGLMPNLCHSAHVLAHPGLHQAVTTYCAHEAQSVQHEVQHLAAHGPYHRPHDEAAPA